MYKESLQKNVEQGSNYHEFVSIGQAEGDHLKWEKGYDELVLASTQKALVESFEREMNGLCLSETWSGDCALQGTAMGRIAEANDSKIRRRFIGRSE